MSQQISSVVPKNLHPMQEAHDGPKGAQERVAAMMGTNAASVHLAEAGATVYPSQFLNALADAGYNANESGSNAQATSAQGAR